MLDKDLPDKVINKYVYHNSNSYYKSMELYTLTNNQQVNKEHGHHHNNDDYNGEYHISSFLDILIDIRTLLNTYIGYVADRNDMLSLQ